MGGQPMLDKANEKIARLTAENKRLREGLLSIEHLLKNRTIHPLSLEQGIMNMCKQALAQGATNREE